MRPGVLTVAVDGRELALEDGDTLAALLEQLGHAPEAVAVAVNGEFVPRAARAQRRLNAGDRVACFKPIVGG